MTLEQRIKLITGVKQYASRSLDAFAFPVFELKDDPMYNAGVRATAFPQDDTLARMWNSTVVTQVYKCVGNETKAADLPAYYNIRNRVEPNTPSSDPFAAARFFAAKTAGLNKSGAFVNLENASVETDAPEQKTESKLIYDLITSASEPDSVVVKRADRAEESVERDANRLMYGVAQNKEEVAAYLAAGYSYVYLAEDFTDELVPYLTELTVEYDKAYDACKRGKITPEKLKLCCDELAMLPLERINDACDNVIDMLIALGANNSAAVLEKKTSVSGAGAPLFDEIEHDKIALTAARQSVVLVKNNGILPFKRETKIALLGEYAKDPSYHDSGNAPTLLGLPFEVINDHEIRATGFAYGYKKGEIGRTDLHKTAAKLCKSSDAALVFLCAEKGAYALPPEQIEFLDALHASGAKIIAAVSADSVIDMAFESKCSAVLFTGRGGQKSASAVFEIIAGSVNPSGKFAAPVPMRINAETGETSGERYPLGYGLSYTAFEYTRLEVSDRGITLTVTNTGEYDGYATVQMYVQKAAENGAQPEDKKLRGYSKIFVKKKDAVKVSLRFGEETFRTYDSEKDLFCVAGGEYIVYVGDSERNIRLKGDLTLAPHVYNEEYFENELEAETDDCDKAFREFADTADKREFYARGKEVSLGLRLAISLMLLVYLNVSVTLLCVYGVVPDITLSYIIVGVAAGVIDVAVIWYIALSVKNRRKARAVRPEPNLGDVVAKLDNFTELASVSYEKPITADRLDEEREEAEKEAEAQPEEIPAEEIIRTYDTGFTEGDRQNIKFREGVSFGELCNNFHDYVLGWGVEVETSSVRAFMAALAASKLIFIDVKNKDVLPTFLLALGGYFQGVEAVEAKESWNRPDHLMWTAEGDKYVASGFVNAVYTALHTPDKNAVAIINKVRTENLRGYFNDFIRYALFPSESHVWRLNDETAVTLPHNIRYLLFTENGFGDLPRDMAGASVQIEMICSAAAAPGEAVEVKPVSVSGWNDLVKEAREEHYLPETVWKKIDELISVINATERFSIGNKSLLQLERLTSVLMACGADESEAFNLAFTAKLAARLKNLEMYARDGGDKKVFGLVEKLFGDENLSKIQKALTKTATAGQAAK